MAIQMGAVTDDETKCYIALYVSDDDNSKKSCDMKLLFGEQNDERVRNPTKADVEFSWKWVRLPCPHCQIVHNFKRETWFEGLPIPLTPFSFRGE